MSASQDHFVLAGGLKLHMQEWGTPDRPLLVFLHGLASTSHMFDLVAPAFAIITATDDPMPREPPVTSAIFPFRLTIEVSDVDSNKLTGTND